MGICLSARLVRPAMVFAAALLAGCGGSEDEAATAPTAPPAQEETIAAEPPAPSEPALVEGSLPWALAGNWRLGSERERDRTLQPIETAELIELSAANSLLELWPRGGYWTAVYAPSLAARDARYVTALIDDERSAEAREAFARRFEDAARFGEIEIASFGPASEPPAEYGSIDAAIAVDAVGAWMALGFADKAFVDVYDALAPGGRFLVIEPRAAAGGVQDPAASNGYVRQAYVVALAEDVGFTLAETSELHANPLDPRGHPFGVWTLAPWRLTAPLGEPGNPNFNRERYDFIGEPDRMTLVFEKPDPDETQETASPPPG